MIEITVKMGTETCCNCGIFFAIPEYFQTKRKEKHDIFYCPAGHEQYYLEKTEEERLRERLTAAMDRETNLANELNRLKSRLRRGVCPCCKRSFGNIGRHIKTKHPEFK